jgi:hypothetical protein
MGRAIEYMPYIVFAVSEMARRGLGFDRRRFELESVTLLGLSGNRSIYSGRHQTIATPPDSRINLADLIRARLSHLTGQGAQRPARSPLITHNSSLITLAFLSPTRIRIDGAPQSAPTFDLLIRSLLRRLSMLFAVHGRANFDVEYKDLIARAAEVRVRSSDLTWWDFERYSNRQQCKMKLGGFIGQIEYEGDNLEQFLPLIAAGEILHAGSNTTFGLGRYEIATAGSRNLNQGGL